MIEQRAAAKRLCGMVVEGHHLAQFRQSEDPAVAVLRYLNVPFEEDLNKEVVSEDEEENMLRHAHGYHNKDEETMEEVQGNKREREERDQEIWGGMVSR